TDPAAVREWNAVQALASGDGRRIAAVLHRDAGNLADAVVYRWLRDRDGGVPAEFFFPEEVDRYRLTSLWSAEGVFRWLELPPRLLDRRDLINDALSALNVLPCREADVTHFAAEVRRLRQRIAAGEETYHRLPRGPFASLATVAQLVELFEGLYPPGPTARPGPGV